jgi:phage tail sheath protein FI
MKALVIKDLLRNENLDRKAMSTVRGGRTINMFLRRVWRDGALFGRTPADNLTESETTQAASSELSL